mmetsp:Transcript_6832/g.29090  ORF Transcript_6832/g.29090 Transcript_6832/m.29090 type:complete len:271 (-) Transcript_6832:2077-2889(-)
MCATLETRLHPKGSSTWSRSANSGPTRYTTACATIPANASMPSRPCFTSATRVASFCKPSGSNGKDDHAPDSPVAMKPFTRFSSRTPMTANWIASSAFAGRAYDAAPPADHQGAAPAASAATTPTTAAMAHRPCMSSASWYHASRLGSTPSPSGSNPASPGMEPSRCAGGTVTAPSHMSLSSLRLARPRGAVMRAFASAPAVARSACAFAASEALRPTASDLRIFFFATDAFASFALASADRFASSARASIARFAFSSAFFFSPSFSASR